ncbi:MAG: DUF1667 domain-containing protein [Oscillospiraceae bacterium]|nr:DUF1667 domain-containing protein [Oscillospiraceae bacterium]
MKDLYCITCPAGCKLTVIGSGFDMIVEGNKCEKGREFATHEMSNPSRTLTTTVRTKFPGVPVISVRTAGEIPRDKLMSAMRELSDVVVETELEVGDTVLEDVAKTGISVIITSSALMKLGAELENKNVELSKRGSVSAQDTSSSGFSGQGIGIVRNPDALDDLGADAAGGFVGAAGEAVGVEDTFEDETAGETQNSENRLRPSGRPHIRK